ncbi:MAG TPA: proton-conducting transporter membrane subunit, partial [Arenicellales bacterium]|nr:proton-conducting transporter membrane subunit [Arenicellales bacterium]
MTLLGIDNHLPALQVVIPLMGAPLCFLLRRPVLAWGFSVAISSATLIIAFLLLQTTLQTGPLSYALGGWAAPWGIEYRVDTLNGYILLLVTAISTLSLLYARTSFEHEINSAQLPLLYAGWLLCLTGFLGMTITGDAFNVFVFLEISSLSSYLLISLGPDRRSLTAAFRYLVIGTIGATFILIAIGLFYSMTGTLNMADLAILLSKNTESRTFHAAIGFLLIGLAIKAAIFPLHLWLPNAYTWAPSAVSVFLAATATKVAIYLLLRFLFTVIGADHSFNLFTLNQALLPLGVLAVLIGSVVAIYQDNIKKLLAYSSVAQIG